MANEFNLLRDDTGIMQRLLTAGKGPVTAYVGEEA